MTRGLIPQSHRDSRVNLFHGDINSWFNDFFTLEPALNTDWAPGIDIEENEKAITVKTELPGMEEKDITVEVKENILTISGEKKEEKTEEDKEKKYTYTERKFGSFCRSIALSDAVKIDEIKAEYKNGLLSVELPKAEKAQPKRVNIEVN